MTQKDIALKLIDETLYKKHPWFPTGKITADGFQLKAASTTVGKAIITINYDTQIITVNKKRQRLPKTVVTDLLTIVRLKIAKKLKKYASRNRIEQSFNL